MLIKQLNGKKGLICDFDDTLVATFDFVSSLSTEVCQDLNLTIPTPKFIKARWGKSFDEVLEYIALMCNWPKGTIPRFKKLFLKKEYEEKRFASVIPGAIETLKTLKEVFGFRLAVATNRSAKYSHIFDHLNIRNGLFDKIQFQEPDKNLIKPYPEILDPILKKFKKLGVLPDKIVYVGDSPENDYGVVKNHKAEILFLGVTSGIYNQEAFTEIPKENILPNVANLIIKG